MTEKNTPHKKTPFEMMVEDGKAAAEADNEVEFLRIEKKLLLMAVSAAINLYADQAKSKAQIKQTPKRMHNILLGGLAGILTMDKNIPKHWKNPPPEEESDGA